MYARRQPLSHDRTSAVRISRGRCNSYLRSSIVGELPTQCSVIEHSRVRAGRKMGLKLLFSLPVIPVGSVRRGESLWYPKDMRVPFSFSQTCASVPEITTLE